MTDTVLHCVALTQVESFTDAFANWIPLYFFAKAGFLVWCFLPSTRGACFIYHNVLRPLLLRNRSQMRRHRAPRPPPRRPSTKDTDTDHKEELAHRLSRSGSLTHMESEHTALLAKVERAFPITGELQEEHKARDKRGDAIPWTMFVYCSKATGVKIGDKNGTSDPYCKLYVIFP